MTPDEMIEVIQAFSDGKEVEFCCSSDGSWWGLSRPEWNFSEFDYRIKPQPKPNVVIDHVVYADEKRGPIAFVPNLRLTFSGETQELISAEVLK